MNRKLAVAIMVLVGLLFQPATANSAVVPGSNAVFNNPLSGDVDEMRKILDTVKGAVDDVRCSRKHKEDEIRVATFLLQSFSFVKKLIRKHKQGCSVRVVVDRKITHPSLKTLKRGLASRKKRRYGNSSVVTAVDGAMHAKAFLFRNTGKDRYVTMVGSQNANAGANHNGWNDMTILTGRPDVYAAVRKYHVQLMRQTPANPDYQEWTAGNVTVRGFPLDSTRAGDDPVFRDLQRVRCHGARGETGKNGRTVVRVNVFYISGRNGLRIARQLRDLGKKGCNVQIIVGAPGTTVMKILRKAARARQLKLYDSRQREVDGVYTLRSHSKYMIVSGHVGRDRSAEIVTTGSWNMSENVRNDDLQIVVSDDSFLTDKYFKGFALVRPYCELIFGKKRKRR